MGHWVSAIYSSVNIGTELPARCGLSYPLNCLLIPRATWLVILDDKEILFAFVATNVILDSIFALIATINAMEEIMVEIMVSHPGLITITIIFPIPIPILLPTQIQIQIQTQIRLKILHQHPSGSTLIHMNRINS